MDAEERAKWLVSSLSTHNLRCLLVQCLAINIDFLDICYDLSGPNRLCVAFIGPSGPSARRDILEIRRLFYLP